MAMLEINDWMIRYHPVWAERRKGKEREKDLCVEKKRLIRPPTPPDTLKSMINSRTEPKVDD
eukprot:scaffold9698_cov35-Phaeocystis_antarctica.AAC.2